VQINWVTTDPGDLNQIRALFEEYHVELGVDLCFQGFQEELETLPGRYGSPRGALLMLLEGDQIAGCGALRDLGDGIAEVKRMMVRPDFRGEGFGRAILLALLEKAKELGYTKVRLDTLRRLTAAINLYQAEGFTEIPPYNPNPEPDIVYLERSL